MADGQDSIFAKNYQNHAPRHYHAPHVTRPVNISGKMNDPLWNLAPWTDDFVDILGDAGPKPRYRTRVKMLWDDTYLTIGAELEEPHVWATLTEHDSVIFHDNDFEVFIDPDSDTQMYGEFEINALNTTWDLLLGKPYRVGGPAINGWEIHGIKTATYINGTLNDPSDTDTGWTVEIAYPWATLAEISRKQIPPKPGDSMRINFSRVEWEVSVIDGKYQKVPGKPEDNWVWSPHRQVDMHRPEQWGILHFAKNGVGLTHSAEPNERTVLVELYERQRDFRHHTGRWASSVSELEFVETPGLRMASTSTFLEMNLGDWNIDHDGRIWTS